MKGEGEQVLLLEIIESYPKEEGAHNSSGNCGETNHRQWYCHETWEEVERKYREFLSFIAPPVSDLSVPPVGT